MYRTMFCSEAHFPDGRTKDGRTKDGRTKDGRSKDGRPKDGRTKDGQTREENEHINDIITQTGDNGEEPCNHATGKVGQQKETS